MRDFLHWLWSDADASDYVFGVVAMLAICAAWLGFVYVLLLIFWLIDNGFGLLVASLFVGISFGLVFRAYRKDRKRRNKWKPEYPLPDLPQK